MEKNLEYQEENISDQVEVEAEGKTWRMDKRSVAYITNNKLLVL